MVQHHEQNFHDLTRHCLCGRAFVHYFTLQVQVLPWNEIKKTCIDITVQFQTKRRALILGDHKLTRHLGRLCSSCYLRFPSSHLCSS